MSKFIIHGPAKLSGEVKISGAKNSALKILVATILADSPSVIENVPRIIDIEKVENILRKLGAKVEVNGNTVTVDPKLINSTVLDKDLTKKLRGSIVFAGPMLSKFHQVTFSQPGGCLIGVRPIDEHLNMFRELGIEIKESGQEYRLKGKPRAGKTICTSMSVTTTENAIMAAVLSDGITKIQVAAAEPEIADLISYLNSMGAKISGENTHEITIEGVSSLHGTSHRVIPDRIEAGTFLCAAVVSNSEIKIVDVIPEHMSIIFERLRQGGAKFEIAKEIDKYIILTKKRGQLKSVSIDARPYPGFPTDLQSIYAVLAIVSAGPTRIFETIFESRFGYVEELKKMGAEIKIVSAHIISVNGPTKLQGTEIYCSDIRAGAALVIAAIISEGETIIDNIELIERGYEKLDQKLKNLGVDIKVIP